MPELDTIELSSCLDKLKAAMKNPYAVERYITCKNPNYIHPGWVDLQKQHKSKTQSVR